MRLSAIAASLFIVLAAAPSFAQPPAAPAPIITAVLVNLTVKPEDRPKLAPVMPSEVRETLKLYLDGKIQQWYSRADGRGVMFIMNVNTVDEAKAIMGSLPLAKSGLATLDYTPLAPLQPLRALLAEPAK
jgi:hypothetical protein